MESLRLVGLDRVIQDFPEGANTTLGIMGLPLDDEQLARMTLARAIVSQPRLLLIGPLIDILPEPALYVVLDALLKDDAPWSLILVSTNPKVTEAVQGRARFIQLEPEPGQED